MDLSRKDFLKIAAASTVGSVACSKVSTPSEARPASDPPERAASSREKVPTKGVTQEVVGFIADADIERFPEAVIKEAKRCLIDGFGVMLAGSTLRGSEIVREHIKATGGKPEATVLGAARMSATVEQAALANGASGHALDYDDTQLSTTPDRTFGLLTHPTVPVLASALAVAERTGATGREFLQAFLIGMEVECKIAEAIFPEHYNNGFHSTGTMGTFGAAAATARLLKQEPAAIAHTIAIAASLASGIRVNFGTMTKPLHAGRAAQNGVFAASIASAGFTGGADGLDGEWGFFAVCGRGADTNRIAGMLGNPFTLITPGVSIKPYPCGSLGHPTMDAMLKLVTDHDIKPEQVKQVKVRAGSNILKPLRYKTAKTELEAKFCLPFMMSALLLRRKAGIHEFTDEFVSSELVQRMMPLVETQFDQAIEDRGFDKMRSVVEVHLADGRSFEQPSDDRYRGGPERPFTREELHEKFTDCASLVLAKDRMARALELIETVDRLNRVKPMVEAMS